MKQSKSSSLILLMSCFILSAYSAHAKDLVLQSIQNLDEAEFRSSEGNYFRLIQLNRGCRIEARYYLEMENLLFSYKFIDQKLLHASRKTFRYHYKEGQEGSLMAVTGVYQHSSETYKLDDLKVQSEFKKYQALFPTRYLKQCI
ncbi:hypothetical protein [Acinetobacter bereziniae]|uniref:hypothetical protein n=1 Tax=Acinetobacter bereziniae TaxID=106648 RepID=UPI000C2B5D18|nr:hypothetical protein [Acinetobacter bereziniae]ATZ65282.1 hypothetical protein BSR55_19115 [Acinetobacter bereziniae]MCV2443093.1 hypothetical protein [Acinetobacter bereziniae]